MKKGISILFLMFVYIPISILILFDTITAETLDVPIMRIAAGGYHTCSILGYGKVSCWGDNWHGQLGNGTKKDSSRPVEVLEINNAVDISSGYSHSCALLADNTIRCWGDNWCGQLGDGFRTDSSRPIEVYDIPIAVGIASGAFHTCALLIDGTIRCWGENQYGQLGNGYKIRSSRPVEVLEINNAVGIVAGAFYTCAILDDGTVKCWGKNSYGQIEDISWDSSDKPVKVFDIDPSNSPEVTRVELNMEGVTVAIEAENSDITLTKKAAGPITELGLTGRYNNIYTVATFEEKIKVFINHYEPLISLVQKDSKVKLRCFGENKHGVLDWRNVTDKECLDTNNILCGIVKHFSGLFRFFCRKYSDNVI